MNTTIFKKAGNFITKNSPTILTWVGVSGLLTTNIMAVSATPKALRIIEEEESQIKRPLTRKEIVKATWKCYAPSAAIGAITIACMVGSNSINVRRNAALAGLYSLSETALKEYQSKVVETIGTAKHREIKESIHKDKIDKNPVSKNEVILTSSGETLCFDAQSGRYFKSDMETIKRALNDLSRKLMSDMYISLNEVYYELGLEGTKLGDLVGWHIDWGTISPQFSSQLADDGRPCLVLDFEDQPRYCDRDY